MICTLTACAAGGAERRAGADRDVHGCIASAGYVWSGVRGECIRLFETGLAFLPEHPPAQGAMLAAYMVLPSASGATQAAEVFVPGQAQPLRLHWQHDPAGSRILVNRSAGVTVFKEAGLCILDVQGQRYLLSSRHAASAACPR